MKTRPNPVYLLALLLLALPAMAQAQFDFSANSDGSLSVSSYTGTNASVTIPSSNDSLPVTGIADYAFFYNASLTNIIIPASITNIGDLAFNECGNLIAITVTNINPDYSSMAGVLFNKNQTTLIAYPESLAGAYSIPATVASVVNSAFEICTNLTSVTIPAGVTNIGEEPFEGCSSVATISVAASNPDYSSVAGVLFNTNKTALIEYPAAKVGTAYSITNTVAAIEDFAFDGCINPTSITIPNSVTNIGNNAFASCNNLTNITIGGGVAAIGNFAFSSCFALPAITIPNSVTNIGYSVFLDCTNLVSVVLPANFPNIDEDVFNSCYHLATITIPDSVTNIGLEAFAGCWSLTNVVIGTNVATIGYAFPACTNLPGISLPASVTSVAGNAFLGCSNLTAINVAANNPDYSSVAGVLFNHNQTALIDYPEGKTGTYYAIPNNVTNIGYEAFADCDNPVNITIPNSVTSIGDYAFYNCLDLTNACFEGSPPAYNSDPGFDYDPALTNIYYQAEATGWGSSYASVPTTSCAECTGVDLGTSIAGISLSGSNLVLNGINNQSSGTNYILTSTNLALSVAQWTRVATNVFNTNGNFTVTVTNTVNRSTRQRFYIIQTQ